MGLLFPVNHAPKKKWCSHVDLHHEPSPSQGEMQNSYTLRAIESWLPRMDSHHQHPVSETGVLLVELQGMAFVAGLAPANHGLERPAARLLGAHEQKEWPTRPVARRRLLLFREALICLSYSW